MAALKKMAQNAKASACDNDISGRCSCISMGQSSKKGCSYAFAAKEYSSLSGKLLIRFVAQDLPWSQEEHVGCAALLHECCQCCVPHTKRSIYAL
jgi:1-deoxy-D-xylulose 5-phosphate reductoisomerase